MTAPLFGGPSRERTRRAGIGSHHSHASVTDEWLTPPWLLARLGRFDLDPCAPADRPWPTAEKHLTVRENGLRSPWSGRVFCNPPYSQVDGWMARLAAHGEGTALVFARTETAWFHESVWDAASACLFLRGRLTFYLPDGTPGRYTAGGPSVLVAYGEAEAVELGELRDLGAWIRL